MQIEEKQETKCALCRDNHLCAYGARLPEKACVLPLHNAPYDLRNVWQTEPSMKAIIAAAPIPHRHQLIDDDTSASISENAG